MFQTINNKQKFIYSLYVKEYSHFKHHIKKRRSKERKIKIEERKSGGANDENSCF